jgi:hypothetical protein
MVGRSARRAPARCLRWDHFVPPRVLGARVAAIAVAWTCWPSGHDPFVLAPALFNGARGFSRFDVAQFRCCVQCDCIVLRAARCGAR